MPRIIGLPFALAITLFLAVILCGIGTVSMIRFNLDSGGAGAAPAAPVVRGPGFNAITCWSCSGSVGATEWDLADELIDIIITTIEPDAWEDNGGLAATIRYHEGAYLVTAPPYMHRGVESLLDMIRRNRAEHLLAGEPPEDVLRRAIRWIHDDRLSDAMTAAVWIAQRHPDLDMTAAIEAVAGHPRFSDGFNEAIDQLHVTLGQAIRARAIGIRRRALLASRLDPVLHELAFDGAARFELQSLLGDHTTDVVPAVRVAIELVAIDDEVIRKLETAGALIERRSDRQPLVAGHVPIVALVEIASIDGVRRITALDVARHGGASD